MIKSGYSIDVTLGGADRTARALTRAKPILGEKTVPLMEAAADKIASAATSRAVQSPSGLWKTGKRGRLASPSYRKEKPGRYWVRVVTPGTAAGRAEAMSEFARLATRPQGAGMVRVLDSLYGRPGGSGGGRILWTAADELDEGIAADIERAVDAAADGIEREMGDA